MSIAIAPPTAVGLTQIIPTTGPHQAVFVPDWLAEELVYEGWIYYDPDYGPNARIYRPFGTVEYKGLLWMTEGIADAYSRYMSRKSV